MPSKKIVNKKDKGLPEALGIGLLAGVILTLLGTGLLALLIGNETMDITAMSPGCIVIHLIGSALTGLVAYGVMKRQRIVVCALSALCYFLVQVGITALFFDGQYQGIGAGVLSIIGGGVLSVLPGFISRSSGGKKLKIQSFR